MADPSTPNDIPQPRKGQAPPELTRAAFAERFAQSYFDPAYDSVRSELQRIEAIAWEAYSEGRKAPRTAKAGPGFADPDYALSVEWRECRDKLLAAERHQKDPLTPSRALIVCGSSRNDGTCPGEMSKTYRLAKLAQDTLDAEGIEPDFLDLSRLTSDYSRRIHPCKACVSTAMPLCHWPCSCYPNHALNQVGDWMNEIYERWTAAHGVMLLTPVNWYSTSSALKLMIDRLVCADGGNPDPTTTHGKDPGRAKALELAGWPYPKHLAGRTYALVVHGDVSGVLDARRALSDWLDWTGLIHAGPASQLERYIGYYEPYATSHETLDGDEAIQEEVRNAARALAQSITQIRAGTFVAPGRDLQQPRPK
jgi:multimeric flavodoxin WrbA